MLTNLEAARAWVLEQNEENLATARVPTSRATAAFPETGSAQPAAAGASSRTST